MGLYERVSLELVLPSGLRSLVPSVQIIRTGVEILVGDYVREGVAGADVVVGARIDGFISTSIAVIVVESSSGIISEGVSKELISSSGYRYRYHRHKGRNTCWGIRSRGCRRS